MTALDRAPQASDIVGKTIARLLQSEWDHSENYSSCDFYIEFSDGSLVHVGYHSLELISAESRSSLSLRWVGRYRFSHLLAEGDKRVGARVERVLTATFDAVFVVLSGQRYLRSGSDNGQTELCFYDHEEFLHWTRLLEFFDYWTKEPVIFNNTRGVDLRVTSQVDDLLLTESKLVLAVDRLQNGTATHFTSPVNSPTDAGWTARFMVPEPGRYRVTVYRQHSKFITDLEVDESVIERGWLAIHVE